MRLGKAPTFQPLRRRQLGRLLSRLCGAAFVLAAVALVGHLLGILENTHAGVVADAHAQVAAVEHAEVVDPPTEPSHGGCPESGDHHDCTGNGGGHDDEVACGFLLPGGTGDQLLTLPASLTIDTLPTTTCCAIPASAVVETEREPPDLVSELQINRV